MKGGGKGKGKVIKWEIPEKEKALARQEFSRECSLDKKTSRTQTVNMKQETEYSPGLALKVSDCFI